MPKGQQILMERTGEQCFFTHQPQEESLSLFLPEVCIKNIRPRSIPAKLQSTFCLNWHHSKFKDEDEA